MYLAMAYKNLAGTEKPRYLCLRVPLALAVAALIVVSVAEAGTISGEAKFVGVSSGSKAIPVTKDQDYCGLTVPDDSVVVGTGRGLKNVVVYLDGDWGQAVSTGKEIVLNTDGCRFSPCVTAMVLGEKFTVRNSDPKLHIVHSYLEDKTVFNIAVPFPGHRMEITHKIKKTGMMQINCDTHGWMRGYIHVFDHPYFAVTDEKGSFSVLNVPPGTYTLKAWHEKAGVQSIEVRVPEEGEVKINFDFGR